ncbi:MAG: ribonuclease P protein component [Candidatus Niyogibacteria bacterium RIFCSPLOWO2_01_FULL_45_48]|uniref:Ribonuclease P protein component n=2 Tax=Candidatus Niyogiibacteriota TaxID=1817912 RepID=A0A1G2EXJ1_9BACT|nr:MAG: ribonuclease P protein component [Candidatus Niyogibacteria bacterium RIFCSPLOWO2_01_FULL_45_48]OGZ30123.1 MAG: ribonuclease P protein component [Candidatus Niyogibacteria bacterium RIFCSPHIGHO2_01_FULL_45_28]OGZ30483.1 MAG: ribonuclease P protein component [Candidatus Niyogibacteria bacterium RIFCSPLOWO2_02_FULL_45_13]
MAFARKNRLSGKNAVNAVIRGGRKVVSGGFIAYFKESAEKNWRAAISVSKKVDKRSTVRNKLRRRISEIMKKNITGKNRCFDIFIQVRPEAAGLDFERLNGEFVRVFKSMASL